MWKAVLVLFVTSNTQPVSMMVGQFPETFLNQATCQTFIKAKDGEIDGSVEIISKSVNLGFKVLRQDMHCIEDTGGEPV